MDSIEFNKERNPLKISPTEELMSESKRSHPAGVISPFGQKLLQIDGKSPVDLSRKAKFITSISLGDTKLNYAHSTDREHNGRLIAPEGLETIN